ncbi:MAG: transglycosylase SLT domain-containing protein [Flavobacteriales bacterium]|nr:transglycosylase SLT domain-containing protein [Flavobacteriales bacterium]
MTVKQRTGLWILLAAVGGASVVGWYLRSQRMHALDHVPWAVPKVQRDLKEIKQDTLRLLTIRDPLTYEERPGAITGFEFELVERFARHLDVPLKVVVMDDRDSMYAALQEGRGDVIAAVYTPLRPERKWFSCSAPIYTVQPMIARIRSEGRAGSAMEEVDSLVVSEWSPFRPGPHGRGRLKGMTIVRCTPDEALVDVVLGRSPACLVTDATAMHEGARMSALEFVPAKGGERTISFAARKNAPELVVTLDEWLGDPDETRFRTVLLDGYLGRLPKPGPLRQRTMPVAPDSISPYDAEFQAHGDPAGWKWQLLAAMAWRESRFDSTAVSSKGAQGIMQFMPNTAVRYGLDTAMAVGDHIRAAGRYISRLDTVWMRAVPDRDQRLRFVLASYNAGVGHIIDAQRLAERLGLDPQRWENNVERTVLLLAKPAFYMRPELKNGYCKGSQVFHYVRDIIGLYDHLVRSGKAGARTTTSAERMDGTGPPMRE